MTSQLQRKSKRTPLLLSDPVEEANDRLKKAPQRIRDSELICYENSEKDTSQKDAFDQLFEKS